MRPLLLSVLTFLLLAVPASQAFADALVVVQVRGPDGTPEGRVTLASRDGEQTYSCQTTERTCRINEVPGGRYIVRFEPATGEAPPPRPAMIPPSGTVTLFVSVASGS